MKLKLIFLLIASSFCHPGDIQLPSVVAKEFMVRFMKAINSKEPLEMIQLFSRTYMKIEENIKIFEDLPNQLSRYQYTIRYAQYHIHVDAEDRTWNVNMTVKFTGIQNSKLYDFILENKNKVPQLVPTWWCIREMKMVQIAF